VDAYDLRARHFPAVIAALPALTVFGLVAGEYGVSLSLPFLSSLGATGAIFALLARIARVRGRAVEIRLWEGWGGSPTILGLRHRDTLLNVYTKQAYHQRLSGIIPGLKMPTAAEEAADPVEADARYEAAVDELRRRAKASRNAAVARENISYGFARNLYGLKLYAIGLAGIGFLTVTVLAVLGLWRGALPSNLVLDYLVMVGLTLYAIIIAAFVTTNFVRHHADAYTKVLFETIAPLPARRRSQTA
jgi:hypothetical protein